MPAATLRKQLASPASGLSAAEAARRRAHDGANVLHTGHETRALRLLLRQLRSPLAPILLVAVAVAVTIGEWLDAGIIPGIRLLSTGLSVFQEYHAGRAVERLQASIAARCRVLRDGRIDTLPASELVPGDIVVLAAGSLVPADAVVLEAHALFVAQALLTGETFPVERNPGVSAADAPLSERTNCLYMGTSIRSGTATALIVQIGRAIAFGAIAGRIAADRGETEFERGLRRFGGLLMRTMLVVVLAVRSVNLLLGRPLGDTLLFAMALAATLLLRGPTLWLPMLPGLWLMRRELRARPG